MRLLCAILLSVATACTAATAPAASPTGGATSATSGATTLASDRLQLLHTDDIHGHLDYDVIRSGSSSFNQGGLAQTAAQVNVLRARGADRTILVDAGDAWQGTFISNANRGEAVTKAMSLMKYDAMAVGNHDFDWGQEILAQRAKEASFPFLATNLVETATGKLPAYLKPYVVKTTPLARVGILGITNPEGNTIVKATSVAGLKFGAPASGIQPYLSELQKLADIIVVVAHVGSADATKLARDVPGIDVIVAGHDHIAVQTARVEGKTTIVDSGAYTQYLGRLEIIVDPTTHKMKDAIRAGELVAIAANQSLKPDPEVAAIVDARRAEADKYTSRVVGVIKNDLDNPRDENGIGNMIGDAFVEYGKKMGWKTDVGFYNAAGVRAPLTAGPVTYGQLYQVLPFENTVVSVDLTGDQLRVSLPQRRG